MCTAVRNPLLALALALAWAITLAGAGPTMAQSQGAAWQALREPGTAALIRHALAPGTGDPADFELGDCSTQRNLNDAGRAQARAIGQAMRARDMAVDRVLTSRWCRCRDTARLLEVAPVEPFPPLDSFFEDRSTAEPQTAATRELLRQRIAQEKLVLVTHQVNITALTDVFPRSGEIVVVGLDDSGDVEVRGRIPMAAGE